MAIFITKCSLRCLRKSNETTVISTPSKAIFFFRMHPCLVSDKWREPYQDKLWLMHSPLCISGLMTSPIKYHAKCIGSATEWGEEDIFLLHKHSQYKHHQDEGCFAIFFHILRCSFHVSGGRKLITCPQRLQTSKCSLLLARIRLTQIWSLVLRPYLFTQKLTLISNCSTSLFCQEAATIYHHCYYGISITSFHCDLRKHFVETQRKICHVSIQTYGRKKP